MDAKDDTKLLGHATLLRRLVYAYTNLKPEAPSKELLTALDEAMDFLNNGFAFEYHGAIVKDGRSVVIRLSDANLDFDDVVGKALGDEFTKMEGKADLYLLVKRETKK